MALPYEAIVGAVGKGEVAPVYLLAGPDVLQAQAVVSALRDMVLPPSARDVGFVHLAGPTIRPAEVVTVLRGRSLVGRVLVIVEDAPWFGTREHAEGEPKDREDDSLLSYLERPSPQNVLVLRTNAEADRRRRLYRKIAECGVVLAAVPPKPPASTEWVQRRATRMGLHLTTDQVALVTVRSGGSCAQMDTELAKLAAWAGSAGRIPREAFDQLLPPTSEERVFDLIDAAVTGAGEEALRIGAAVQQQGEPIPLLLFLLAKQLRILIAMEDLVRHGTADAATKQLGLHPYVAQKARQQVRRWTIPALVEGLEAVWCADVSFKQGATDEESALDQALVGIVRAAHRGERDRSTARAR